MNIKGLLIKWLAKEDKDLADGKYKVLSKAAMRLADEADAYACEEGDRMSLEEAIHDVYTITGI